MKIITRAGVPMLIAVLSFAPGAVPAQTVPHAPPAELSVTGEGSVQRTPDEATLLVTIVTANDAATASTSANNRVYEALTTKLTSLQIGSDKVRTQSYDIRFVPKPAQGTPPGERPDRTGYITTRSIAIEIDDVTRVGATIDAATSSGATDIGDVSFGLRDRRAAYRAALAAAIHDAAEQAKSLSEAGGFHLGSIHHVNADSLAPAPPGPRRLFAAGAMTAPVPTSIEPPSGIEVDARVTVDYTIE
jgi:hypothetical protein